MYLAIRYCSHLTGSTIIRVLIVDNYDSFTHNLWHLVYRATGIEAVIVRNDVAPDTLDPSEFDAVILSPGPGHAGVEADVGLCSTVMTWVNMPILGVCLGHQLLGLVNGAKIKRCQFVRHGQLSCIQTEPHWLFDEISPSFSAVRYHSWHVVEVPPTLSILATSEDGTIMAMAHTEHPHVGVQFHPESIDTEFGEQLIFNFLNRFKTPLSPEVCVGAHSVEALPVTHTIEKVALDWCEPQHVVECFQADHPEVVWLDSASPNVTGQQISYVYVHPKDGESWCHDPYTNLLTIRKSDAVSTQKKSLFSAIKDRLAEIRVASMTNSFGFQGGFLGVLPYEARWAGQLETQDSRSTLYFVEQFFVFDHEHSQAYAVFLKPVGDTSSNYGWVNELNRRLAARSTIQRPMLAKKQKPSLSVIEKSTYLTQIEACKEELYRGESYELCLTTELTMSPPECAWSYYLALRASNPAPFSAYLSLPNQWIACSSPEKFMSVDANGCIEAKPIKGTRARANDSADEDRVLAQFKSSEKDRAENLMITDLLRHDVGAHAQFGSVKVPKNRAIETYATVHQMVSTIQAKLREDRTAVDVVRDAFPGGSMTGAPKRRSVAILNKIEKRERGYYAGCIGYFSVCGQSTWNIVIRTAVIDDDKMTIGAGGAIVVQSDPIEEYYEMLTKLFPLLVPFGFESIGEVELSLRAPLQSDVAVRRPSPNTPMINTKIPSG